MIFDIGNIVIDKISDLPFVDKYAGVVRQLKYKGQDGSVKIFPTDCKLTFDECNKGKRYNDLCPDSKKKSVIYLEDSGLRPTDKKGYITDWNCQLNLIAWLNLPLLGKNTCSYSALAIQAILKKFGSQKSNVGNYHLLEILMKGEQPKSTNPFIKYSYDETINQFLMFPYDYFVLNLEVNFRTDERCFVIEDLEDELNCVNQ